MLISIIIPALNKADRIETLLLRLNEQAGAFEVIVVGLDRDALDLAGHQVRLIAEASNEHTAQLYTGVSIAQGDVLLFLNPTIQLPPDALLAIEHNLKLLPQTIGGNFHLKFSQSSLLTQFLAAILKRQRYKGYYYFNSGIFIRREAYEAISGIRPEVRQPELDFVRRMERYGPTLYLPEAVVASPPTSQEVSKWLIRPILMW